MPSLPDTQPTPERVERDGKIPGLELRHRATGSAWFLAYRTKAGQRRHPKLGDARVLSRTQAREIAREILGRVARGEDPTHKTEDRTVAELAARYQEVIMSRRKTTKEAQWRWDALILPALGHLRLRQLTPAKIVDWHHGIASPSLANRAADQLRAALNRAVAWGWLEASPFRIERNPERPRRRVPTVAEIHRILDACATYDQPWFAALLQLLVLTGCRLSELRNARWCDLTPEGLVLPDSKTGPRLVVLNAAARQVLEAVPRHTRHDRILDPGDVHSRWFALRAKLGAPDLRIHDLRRGFASAGVAAGLSLEAVGQLLGHRNAQTTKRYAYLVTDAARVATEAVASRLLPAPAAQEQGDGPAGR